jgi:hypothetical protein
MPEPLRLGVPLLHPRGLNLARELVALSAAHSVP